MKRFRLASLGQQWVVYDSHTDHVLILGDKKVAQAIMNFCNDDSMPWRELPWDEIVSGKSMLNIFDLSRKNYDR